MKTKNKILVIVEIAIVLCSLFLVAIPAIAADTQKVSASKVTTASEDDFTLDIHGNANEDDTIDMGDVVYIKLAIFGKKPKTTLCDAKYDERINVLDVIQTKLIILGKEKELTLVDSSDRIVTVKKPVERIVAMNYDTGRAIRILKGEDKIVGISEYMAQNQKLFFLDLPSVGSRGSPDYEKIIDLKPDIIMSYLSLKPQHANELEEKLEPAGITVVAIGHANPLTMREDIEKLGYILGRRNEAVEFIDWYKNILDNIKSRTEGLSEGKKPRVYIESCGKLTFSRGTDDDMMCTIAGGINIASDLIGTTYPKNPEVDPEWIITQNPDIIRKHASKKSKISGYNVDDPSEIKNLEKTILERPGFFSINAVKNGRVYLISVDLTRGPEFWVTLAYQAKLFHPALFEDLDPEAIHKEYLTRFLRLDYDLDKHGVFVYPPIIKGKGELAGIPDRYYDSIVAQP